MIVAVIAQTKQRAQQLADDLGIDTPWLFSPRNIVAAEGLRVDRAIIDTDANVDDGTLQVIINTTIKTPGGRVNYVSVRRRA